MAKYTLPEILNNIRAATSKGTIPEDVAEVLEQAHLAFINDSSSFGMMELQGDKKVAELLLKLGYWVALGKLSREGFQILKAQIPSERNAGWDVETPGYTGHLNDKPDPALGPVLSSPWHHSEGSDKSYAGRLYLSNGTTLDGGSVRYAIAPVADYQRPQKAGCLIALICMPYTLVHKLIEKTLFH